MTITLLPHQLEGVAWLKSREESTNAGGILADDMGLGKTIQTISLILANRSKDAKCKSTLVVAPLALIKQWELEVQTRTKKGSLSVLVYHGPSRPKDIAKLRATDVVITTYQVVASEYPDGLLYKNKWFRVVLDEAQTIKNKKTKSAIGCCALEADRRFCLSGTPLQNNIDEFYSFLKFLRFRPFHDYAMFKRQISEPMSRGRSVLAYNRLRAIFQVIMLRRTKASKIDGKPLLQLPARNVNIEKVSLGPDELEFYTTLETRIKSTLKGFQQDGYGKNFTNILVLLLRLRQACDHRQLVGLGVDKEGEVQPDKGADLDDDVDEMIIQDAPAGQKECNTCAKTLERTWDGKVKTEEADAKWVSSAKVDKVNVTACIVSTSSDAKPAHKIIIFSQFTSMLNIVEKPLKRKGYKFCRYDGSMKNAHREEALERLRSDPETKILLISLKCGSLGLNLTAANRVIMLDMWWNPALEDQAIDRVHRIGQTKDVEVIRLAVENTVEDRILALQERKRTMIESALGNTKGKKNQKLSVNELLQLFG
ncbi:SNF2 family N-terminal domain-containing protein [Fimicolochytrium jonesii]|uniref:SNF2 family N-terminal domain-containing protein n=1 Tax=Fimicolochytrium jonesii TaxID=1396493 RepID=UPI0022FDB627|nr:SNF2 family N-terminal domain-containing protein [Fimicolochytrium jonesii]KAI8822237.1 SNF2 family N-terminal domain-containing protein [Fimicolochytrium jonesii]